MTTQRINNWERKLLDLTMDNALLNTRFGGQCILFKERATNSILDELLQNNATLPLLWGDNEDEGLHSDMDKEHLSKTAKKILRSSQNNLSELGSSQLFLGLGMLHYVDNPDPLHPNAVPQSHCAPVMLVPVTLQQQAVVGKYVIYSLNDDILTNSTLVEFLYQEHDRDLRHLVTNLGENPNRKEVFDAFSMMAQSKDNWNFSDELCLGIFAFSKCVMWNDIHAYPDRIRKSPLIRSLIEQRPVTNGSQNPVDYTSMDRDFEPSDFALPIAADASQLKAIYDASLGRSFLLYGPPGTGKSQTITNIIANMLFKGRQTLFVAQKRAALEVVQERLKEIGLSAYCLELHSNKVTKQYMISQLHEVLDLAESEATKVSFMENSNRLMESRTKLCHYIESVNKPYPCASGTYSLADCIEQSLRHHSDLDIPIKTETLLALSDKDLEQIGNVLHELDVIRHDFTSIYDHPLHQLLPHETRGEQLALIKDTLNKMAEVLDLLIQDEKSLWRKLFHQKEHLLTYNALEEYLREIAIHSLRSDQSLLEKRNLIDQWLQAWNLMPQWATLASRYCLLNSLGVEQLGELLHKEDADQLAEALIVQVARARAEALIASEEVLAVFNGRLFEELVASYRSQAEKFRQLTILHIQEQLRANILSVLHDVDPATQHSLTCIRRWCKSKGRGISIRTLMKEHGDVIRKLFPCMLMSPISVAQYIDIADSSLFDIVLFDEASQIPTAEAVGAIARGRAAVIVGDPQQMPPTTFFQNQIEDNDDVEYCDMESILDDFITLGMEEHHLSYHYRSRHESLIAFSNYCYYDNRLITFPSVNDREQRIHYHYVAGVYDYSNTRTNKLEAEAIVDEVIRRLSDDQLCHQSMGIIAFSKVQQNLIEDLLQSRLSHHHLLQKRSMREGEEPLFVKNLENVQGDERDIIFFSVCYGPQENGKISMNFGPLNQTGGHRRLNVAVTRARQEMHVFTSMHYTDIDLERSQAEGVANLRKFLHYAEHSIMPDESLPEDGSCPSLEHPISFILADALRKQGLQVVQHVGRSRFHINLAVVSPVYPDRYLMGILIDDRTYHETSTMRDREVTQPTTLKSLGWHLVRVWQEDYYRNPDRVLQHILDEYHACVEEEARE